MPSYIFGVSILVFTCFWVKLVAEWTTGTFFTVEPESALKGHVVSSSNFYSEVECGLKCVTMESDCKSFNYIEEPNQTKKCEISNMTKHSAPKNDFVRQQYSKYLEPMNSINQEEANPKDTSDVELWDLTARFSNADPAHWMENEGRWWYDKEVPYGKVGDPSDNGDMISEAFWLKNGTEFKITRSDDPTHTALLTTTGNCLGGKTFRGKMASYGVFGGSTHWARNNCRGKCSVVYGGNYSVVEGFSHSTCDDWMQTRNNIGFWCHHEYAAAVLMIGGGGGNTTCNHADHGIGITDDDNARFHYYMDGTREYDFGNTAYTPPFASYSLNLWVR